jgi:hypothetical protein
LAAALEFERQAVARKDAIDSGLILLAAGVGIERQVMVPNRGLIIMSAE